jgi:hypothetical protein
VGFVCLVSFATQNCEYDQSSRQFFGAVVEFVVMSKRLNPLLLTVELMTTLSKSKAFDEVTGSVKHYGLPNGGHIILQRTEPRYSSAPAASSHKLVLVPEPS